MRYNDLNDFLARQRQAIAKGPIMALFVEDNVEVDSAIRHHLDLGFRSLLVFVPDGISIDPALVANIHEIRFDSHAPKAVRRALNKLIDAAAGEWLAYCYNAEYLFFPFCETRTIGEMLTFHTEERRASVLTYAIDVYADDLSANPNAVNRNEAYFDKIGYYASSRPNPDNHNHPHERQLDFFGGLRWRFEEFVPQAKRRIDRIAIFRAADGLALDDNFLFNIQEYNTYSCPWHHNITAAIASFRTAKALKRNPRSRDHIKSFHWHNSLRFDWSSEQLMRRGLMEPGQWF